MSKDMQMCKRYRLGWLARRQETGFSMIEVMVALFVTSIGLLGLAALQMTSLRFSHATQARSQATFLARDIIEQMRAQPTVARSGAFSTTAWESAVATVLPDGTGSAEFDDALGLVVVSIEWGEQDGRPDPFIYRAPL